jgi:hypothetical protein
VERWFRAGQATEDNKWFRAGQATEDNKWFRAGQATEDNLADAHCMLDI